MLSEYIKKLNPFVPASSTGNEGPTKQSTLKSTPASGHVISIMGRASKGSGKPKAQATEVEDEVMSSPDGLDMLKSPTHINKYESLQQATTTPALPRPKPRYQPVVEIIKRRPSVPIARPASLKRPPQDRLDYANSKKPRLNDSSIDAPSHPAMQDSLPHSSKDKTSVEVLEQPICSPLDSSTALEYGSLPNFQKPKQYVISDNKAVYIPREVSPQSTPSTLSPVTKKIGSPNKTFGRLPTALSLKNVRAQVARDTQTNYAVEGAASALTPSKSEGPSQNSFNGARMQPVARLPQTSHKKGKPAKTKLKEAGMPSSSHGSSPRIEDVPEATKPRLPSQELPEFKSPRKAKANSNATGGFLAESEKEEPLPRADGQKHSPGPASGKHLSFPYAARYHSLEAIPTTRGLDARPPHAYWVMIRAAILGSKYQKLPLDTILHLIGVRFPYYSEEVKTAAFERKMMGELNKRQCFYSETLSDGTTRWKVDLEINPLECRTSEAPKRKPMGSANTASGSDSSVPNSIPEGITSNTRSLTSKLIQAAVSATNAKSTAEHTDGVANMPKALSSKSVTVPVVNSPPVWLPPEPKRLPPLPPAEHVIFATSIMQLKDHLEKGGSEAQKVTKVPLHKQLEYDFPTVLRAVILGSPFRCLDTDGIIADTLWKFPHLSPPGEPDKAKKLRHAVMNNLAQYQCFFAVRQPRKKASLWHVDLAIDPRETKRATRPNPKNTISEDPYSTSIHALEAEVTAQLEFYAAKNERFSRRLASFEPDPPPLLPSPEQPGPPFTPLGVPALARVMDRDASSESMASLVYSSEIGPYSRTESADSRGVDEAMSMDAESTVVATKTAAYAGQPKGGLGALFKFVCGHPDTTDGTQCEEWFATKEDRLTHQRYIHGNITFGQKNLVAVSELHAQKAERNLKPVPKIIRKSEKSTKIASGTAGPEPGVSKATRTGSIEL